MRISATFIFSAVACAVFFLICNPAGLYFLSDDLVHIPMLLQGNFVHNHLLRPVANFSIWLDIQTWGMNPLGFHITNLLLHLISSSLVYWMTVIIMRKWGGEAGGNKMIPVFTALLFLCYGFHSEPVFWIVGRVAIVATIFIQLGLILFLKEKPVFWLLSVLCFAAALFSYETSWCFPLLATALSLYEWIVCKNRKLFKFHFVFWALFFFYLLGRYKIFNYSDYGTPANIHDPLIFLRNFSTLLGRLAIPPLKNGNFFLGIFILLVLLAAIYGVVLLKKTRPRFFFMFLIAICMVIAFLPLIGIGIDTHDTEGERFIYLASMFACMFMVLLLRSFFRNLNYFRAAMMALVAAHLFLLYQSSKTYRYASYVSRLTIQSLNKELWVKQITFNNLPTQYGGALLFRIGFVKNSKGILKPSYDSVAINSFRELQAPAKFTLAGNRLDSTKPELIVDFSDDKIIFHQ